MPGKAAYLSRLTSRFRFGKSVEYGQHMEELRSSSAGGGSSALHMEGASPPSVFIGAWGYPKVLVGPMLTQEQGDIALMDTPERWIPEQQTQQGIIDFRMGLVRGQAAVGVKDLGNDIVGKLQHIALAKNAMGAEAEFTKRPRGYQFNEEHQPFGPSAPLKQFRPDNSKWNLHLEKAYNDTDLKAADAVVESYNKGVLISQIQKAFSVGAMGTEKRRRLVPTRWSITAVDDILCKHLLEQVRNLPVIENFQVFEHRALNNYYAILLTPTSWQYEWVEAFIRVLGSEEVIFADHEYNEGKKEYSSVGGCYYSCKFGALEGMLAKGVQAGAIVFREAYPGYAPLGVFNVRQNTRHAMQQAPKEFDDLRAALGYISTKLWLPMQRFVGVSSLLKQIVRENRRPALLIQK
jgi:hypothetical protein